VVVTLPAPGKPLETPVPDSRGLALTVDGASGGTVKSAADWRAFGLHVPDEPAQAR